jgi:hypothetical protein
VGIKRVGLNRGAAVQFRLWGLYHEAGRLGTAIAHSNSGDIILISDLFEWTLRFSNYQITKRMIRSNPESLWKTDIDRAPRCVM